MKTRQIQIPRRLKKGDKIGLVSPSRELLGEWKPLFDNAIKEVESKLGLEVLVGKNVWKQYYYAAGTPKQRVYDFHTMVTDVDIKAIIFTIGGKAAIHMLDLIDWNLVKNNPKIFTGISDSSTLLLPITAKANLVTYYGVEFIKVWGKGISQYELKNIYATLFRRGSLASSFVPNQQRDAVWGELDNDRLKKEEWKVIKKGKAEGNLIGGLMTAMFTLEGTKLLPNLYRAILFLESYSENSEKLHQQLESLKLKGIFNKIKGLILGIQREHFLVQGDERERTLEDIILEVTKEYQFPIVYIPDFGHCVRNLLMPIGIKVTLDTSKENFLSFRQPTVL